MKNEIVDCTTGNAAVVDMTPQEAAAHQAGWDAVQTVIQAADAEKARLATFTESADAKDLEKLLRTGTAAQVDAFVDGKQGQSADRAVLKTALKLLAAQLRR